MENELSNNVIKLNAAEKAKAAAVTKCSKLEEEMKKLKGTEVKEKWTETHKTESKSLYIHVYVSLYWCGSLIDKWLCGRDWLILWYVLQSEAEGMWSKRLEDVNQQLRKSESEKKTLSDRLKAAEKDCSGVKARLQELEKALNDASSKDLEEKLKVLVCPQYRWHIIEIHTCKN